MFYNLLYRLHIENNHDKYAHAVVGFVATFVVGLYSLALGIVIGFVLAVGKEIYDEITYGGFDVEDMLATIGGVGIATVIVRLMT